MGEVISFSKAHSRAGKKQMSKQERCRALARGTLETYQCNSCGKSFEVDEYNKPDKCPHCGLTIRW